MNGIEGARILVVDDHVDLADNLVEILETAGAQVDAVATASDATSVTGAIDVALVDIRLPDATGLSLISTLKQAHGGLIEVLLVTGHASIDDAIEAVHAGAYAYVLKPFDSEHLVATVARAVSAVRLRREAGDLAVALRHGEASLRTLVDTVQALLLELDDAGRVVRANPAAAAATGADAGTLVGVDWVTSFVPDAERSDWSRLFDRLRNGVSTGSIEGRLVRRRAAAGEWVERRISWRVSRLADGDPKFYASGLDMTDVHELGRRTRLAEKLAAVGTVSAGLAHEIRNPLNAAGLQLQLLERRVAKLEQGEGLLGPIDMVRQEIDRLAHLVSDFLLFTRPTDLDTSDIDLVAIARDVVGLHEPAAAERDTVLTLHVPDEPVVVEADSERIKQVVINLLANALEAVDSGGRVDVRVDRDGAGARLAVQDDGPGIPVEEMGRIFEPFFTTKEQGTGLGMAIVHSLVTQHGGDVLLESPGKGAKFVVVLPRYTPKRR